MPIAAKLMTSDEPPAETNGSGMPVTGISPTTTAMLMNAWMQIQPVIPAASSAPNVSGAPSDVRMPEVAEGEEQHDHEARRRAARTPRR